MMRIRLPYPLTAEIMATLTISISVGKEMQLQAARNGVGPEEMQNLINQTLQGAAQTTADALGVPYDSEIE